MSTTTAELAEDVRWMLDCGENLHGIAARLGADPIRLPDVFRRVAPEVGQLLRASVQPPPPPMPFSEMRRITGRRR